VSAPQLRVLCDFARFGVHGVRVNDARTAKSLERKGYLRRHPTMGYSQPHGGWYEITAAGLAALGAS
jgi:hypothetical protein